jgi:hypothetical protein
MSVVSPLVDPEAERATGRQGMVMLGGGGERWEPLGR